MTGMAGKVVQFEKIGKVTFSRNRRSKSVKISVKPDKSVLVSFPFYCTSREVAAFVDKNEAWILQQQKKMALRKSKITPESEFNTKQHAVRFLQGDKFDVLTIKKEVKIIVPDFDSDESQSFIEDVLTQIYRFEAKKYCLQNWQNLPQNLGFNTKK